MKPYKNLIKNKKRLKNSEKKSKRDFLFTNISELKNTEVIKICRVIKKY